MINIKKLIKNFLIIFCIILLWNLASKYSNPVFVPSPKTVFSDLIDNIKSGEIFIALKYSFLRITISTFIAGIIAIPIGLIIFNCKIVRDILYPIISAIRYIPVTAFYPLLIMWFGIDELMKVAFLFIATFVYMMPSVILSLDEINENLLDTGYTMGMNRFQGITRIQIPAILPSLMNCFIMMYGIGWTYIAVAETINAKYGLGFIIQQASSRGRTDLVFMSIIMIMIFSILFDNVSKFLIKKIFKWRYVSDTVE